VAEISIFGLPPGQKAAAGATIVVPLETLLTEQLTMAVDSGAAKRYPFTWCASVGCFARVGFTTEELASLKAGNKATISIVPVAAPTQKVSVDISLVGFTAGFEAVNAANAQ
jgi:invasion protein IalB